MLNVCPECGEVNLCDTCTELFDREAEAMQAIAEEDCCAVAADKFLANLGTGLSATMLQDNRLNIASGEDVCLY